jgi:hypothetical protein
MVFSFCFIINVIIFVKWFTSEKTSIYLEYVGSSMQTNDLVIFAGNQILEVLNLDNDLRMNDDGKDVSRDDRGEKWCENRLQWRELSEQMAMDFKLTGGSSN